MGNHSQAFGCLLFDTTSELDRARFEDALRQAADLLPHALNACVGRREDIRFQLATRIGNCQRETLGALPPDHFEAFESGVLPWAPSWAQAVWTLEATVSALPKDEDQRLLIELKARQSRFEMLEQGLSLCALERGHGNGGVALAMRFIART